MRLRKSPLDAKPRREGRGWGPFTGGQLTVVIVAIAAMFAIPTAALAAGGAFSNNSATVPAVQATNSNAKGTGIKGTGKKYGVYSNGPLGVAAGKSLSCAGCVGGGALAPSAKTRCSGYPHTAVDWSIPGSTPGHGCDLTSANLSGATLSAANLTNADLGFANLTNAELTFATLTGANLTSANMSGAASTQAHYQNTTCPDGTNSDSHGNTCSGHGAP